MHIGYSSKTDMPSFFPSVLLVLKFLSSVCSGVATNSSAPQLKPWVSEWVKLLSCVSLCNPMHWTVARQAPPSTGFSSQEYRSGLPFPFPGDLPDPGIEPRSLALQADALTSEPPGKPPISATRYPLIMLPLSSFVWHHHPQWDYLLSAELRDLGQLCCC